MESGSGQAGWEPRPLASSLRPDADPGCGYRPPLPHAAAANMRGDGPAAPAAAEQQSGSGTLPDLVGLLQAAEPSSAAGKRRLPSLDSDNAAEDHGKRPRANARTSRTYPRRRALVACEVCRARKTKCDNQRPICGSCSALGCNCSYADSSADHSSFDPASLAILERLNYAVSLLESQANQPQAQVAVSTQPPPPPLPPPPVTLDPVVDDEAAHEIELLELSAPTSTTAAHVLAWPVFRNKYDQSSLDAALFDRAQGTESFDSSADPDERVDPPDLQSVQRSRKPGRGICKADVPDLAQAFLENVHTKNPVLDPTDLERWAKGISERGFAWSSRSCLLLIACALGVLSTSFNSGRVPTTNETSLSDTENYTTAETYYNESRERIGFLGTSLIAAQCFFLSGVYEMYSLRPIQAWTSFCRAAGVLQVYRFGNSDPTAAKPTSTISLEHRLYWSCLKSISEMREQFPLPPSRLASLEYPLFPSLPAAIAETNNAEPPLDSIFEKSWFYYLAEISSRRICNRILNAFYKVDHNDWLSSNLESMIQIGYELESQVEQWSQHSPQPVGGAEAGAPPEELAFMTRARQVHMYILLYRPFLFIVIHNPEAVQRDPRVQLLAEKCMHRCIQVASSIGIKHRHHGTWFVGRGLFIIGLIIVAAVKCGRVSVPSDWRRHMNHILAFLEYWELEAPDLGKARTILREVLSEFEGHYA